MKRLSGCVTTISERSTRDAHGGATMKTIETIVTVAEDGTITLRLPPEIPPGKRRVVLVIDDQPIREQPASMADFPVDEYGPWPEYLSLRREDSEDETW